MLRELREFGEPRSSGWGTRVRLLVSGDGMSEREEREVVVVADAELPGRLEGMVGGEERWLREEDGSVGRESRDEDRQDEKYKGIDFSRRSCPVLSPTVK